MRGAPSASATVACRSGCWSSPKSLRSPLPSAVERRGLALARRTRDVASKLQPASERHRQQRRERRELGDLAPQLAVEQRLPEIDARSPRDLGRGRRSGAGRPGAASRPACGSRSRARLQRRAFERRFELALGRGQQITARRLERQLSIGRPASSRSLPCARTARRSARRACRPERLDLERAGEILAEGWRQHREPRQGERQLAAEGLVRQASASSPARVAAAPIDGQALDVEPAHSALRVGPRGEPRRGPEELGGAGRQAGEILGAAGQIDVDRPAPSAPMRRSAARLSRPSTRWPKGAVSGREVARA